MSPTPIPVVVIGRSEAVGGAVVEGIVPEYEGKCPTHQAVRRWGWTTTDSHSHSLHPRRRRQDRAPPPPHQPSPGPQEQQHRHGQLGGPSPRHHVWGCIHPRRHPRAARIGFGHREPATDPVASRRRCTGDPTGSGAWCCRQGVLRVDHTETEGGAGEVEGRREA